MSFREATVESSHQCLDFVNTGQKKRKNKEEKKSCKKYDIKTLKKRKKT